MLVGILRIDAQRFNINMLSNAHREIKGRIRTSIVRSPMQLLTWVNVVGGTIGRCCCCNKVIDKKSSKIQIKSLKN